MLQGFAWPADGILVTETRFYPCRSVAQLVFSYPMSSLRRIHSSRANAARSRGPITAEGQERSSANAIRHALLARCVVLENESGPCLDDLVTQHTQRFAPADGVEFGMIEEMAAAYWRMRRAWAIENRLMEKALHHQPPGDEAARIADAFAELAASPGAEPAPSLQSPPPPHLPARPVQPRLARRTRSTKRTRSHFRTPPALVACLSNPARAAGASQRAQQAIIAVCYGRNRPLSLHVAAAEIARRSR
jgi:hypothetical protein